jgi:flagellin
MAFTINTNITSLQAQNYLRTASDFQGKTINRVTSGLRIVSSGDDAAGLAIANGYRSDESVLTQGIRNANDGLSQLQIADGGISNISQLLDRARTLATQSASGAFTGDRSLLNSEFQGVIGEIDRQAQSIGLNQGGTFAKALNVFIGGGKASNGISAGTNGSVNIDLSKSTVDASSLGLKGVQAIGASGTDIGAGSVATSLSAILANTANSNSVATPGYSSFTLKGPGFDGNGVKISVNTANLGGTSDLVAAVNAAISAAGSGGTQQATALKNANIVAAVNTDSNGKEQLVFNSSSTAFQVEAGDRLSNALMGHFEQNATLTGTDQAATVATNGGGTSARLTLTVDGGSSFNVDVTAVASKSKAQVVKELNLDAGFSTVATAHLEGDQVVLKSKGNTASSSIDLAATTLATNLGLSTAAATAAGASTGADLSTYVAAAGETAAGATTFGATGAGTITFRFQGAGETTPTDVSLTVLAGTTVAQAISTLTTQVGGDSALKAAGISLTTSTATDALTFTSKKGEKFDVQVTGDVQNLLGFGSFVAGAGNSFDYSALSGATYNSPSGTAAGALNLELSINGGASSGNQIAVDLGAGDALAATETAGIAVVDPVNIDSTNNQLNLFVNGTAVAVTLTSSPTATLNNIAAQISTQLDTTLGAGVASASIVANKVTITTTNKGADQSIEVAAGTANTTLGLAATDFQQGTARTGGDIATALNAAFGANSTLQAAGLTADYGVTAAGKITVSSNNGTFFRASAWGTSSAAEVAGTAQVGALATAALYAGSAITYPLTIDSTNDILSVQVNGGGTQTLTLAHGASRTASQIAADINGQIANAVASVDSNGQIQLLSNVLGAGPASRINLLASSAATNGTAASTNLQNYAIVAATNGTAAGSVTQNYAIVGGANDTISVSVNGGTAQVVTLTAGVAQTAVQVKADIDAINGGAGLVGATVSAAGGVVTITSNTTGAASSVKFNVVANSAYATLGFLTGVQAGYTGADSTNNQLSVSVDGGTNQVISLTTGGARTAVQVKADIDAINGGQGLIGATVSTAGNKITIISNTTGAASSVHFTAVANNADAIIGFTAGAHPAYDGAAAVDTAAPALGFAGLGSNVDGTAASANANIVTGTNDTLNLTIDGTAATVTLGPGATSAASAATQINTQLNTALGTIAQTYASTANGRIEIASLTTGANSSVAFSAGNANTTFGFSVGTARGTAADLGFGTAGSTFTGNVNSAAPTTSPNVDAGGASQSSALAFTPIAYGGDDQTITLAAPDGSGVQQSLSVTLRNDVTGRNARSIDEALSAINTALQQTNNSTLQKIVAVKDDSSGTEQIRFLSAVGSFQVSIGATAQATGVGSQGTTNTSTVSAGGSTADISGISTASAAVAALSNSVALLGKAQAVVGRGQNQFNYAINLAQSQLTNLAGAESRIRDADLAAESANLTKAQILLQAGVAALAQANSAPQLVLSLLK